MSRARKVSVSLFLALTATLIVGLMAKPSQAEHHPRILVFSKTDGWRHDSIIDGQKALLEMGDREGIMVDTSENAALFTPEVLATYDAVVFLSTTGTLFNEAQRKAFKEYIRAGGGYVGIHAATDTEYEWPWYNKLVGAQFKNHPHNQTADKVVLTFEHPSTAFLRDELDGNRWERYDEWYNFKNFNEDVTVIMNLDGNTFEGGEHGEHHPIAWYHHYDGGRAFYTAGGHTSESFEEPLFLRHILGGIRWAMGEK